MVRRTQELFDAVVPGIERNGKRDQLFPGSADIFFRKGVEGRILFRADENGEIDALMDRRNNEDVIWRKTK